MTRLRRLIYATNQVRAHPGCACAGCIDPRHTMTSVDDANEGEHDVDEVVDAWAESYLPPDLRSVW